MTLYRAGAGAEAAGDPAGGGGPLHVVRANPVEGQTVRVVFNQEPLHVSAAGNADALNPANYGFALTAGAGEAPVPVGVKRAMVVGPAFGVLAGEFGFDVQTDKPLVIGLGYRVTASFRIQAAAGGLSGFPYSADFFGNVRLATVLPPPRVLSNLDLASDPINGNLTVDDSGDIAPLGGIDGLKMRELRRLSTSQNAFAFLPGYGVGLRLKRPASIRELLAFRADAQAQTKLEPEVADASVTAQMLNAEVLLTTVRARTRTGLVISLDVQSTKGGQIVVGV